VHDFLIGPYLPRWLSAQIYQVFLEEKLLEMMEKILPALRRNTVVPARQGCSSLCTSGLRTSHHHLQWSLDWKWRACGFVSQVTRPHTNTLLPVWPH
jgi:hypothetical protein